MTLNNSQCVLVWQTQDGSVAQLEVRLLSSNLRPAARNAVIQPSFPGTSSHAHPDMKTLGTTGGTDYIYVTYIHPLTNARLNSAPNTVLNTELSNKARSHIGFISRSGAMTKLISMTVLTNGGWSPSAHRFLCPLVEEVAARLCITRSVARAPTLQKDSSH